MALVSHALRTSGRIKLVVLLLLCFCNVETLKRSDPVSVSSGTCDGKSCEYTIRLSADGKGRQLGLTGSPGVERGPCTPALVLLTDVAHDVDDVHVRLPCFDGRYYFCLLTDGDWSHQGDGVFLEACDDDDVISASSDSTTENDLASGLHKQNALSEKMTLMKNELNEATTYGALIHDMDINMMGITLSNDEMNDVIIGDDYYGKENGLESFKDDNKLEVDDREVTRIRRQADDGTKVEGVEPASTAVNNTVVASPKDNGTAANVPAGNTTGVQIKVLGLRVDEADKEPKVVDGVVPSVLRETKFQLRLFGEGLTGDTIIAFTHSPQDYGSVCNYLVQGEYKAKLADSSSAIFEMLAPAPLENDHFYVCAKNGEKGDFIHQGSEKGKILATHNKLLPLWASLVLIVILLMLASLFSGLNLGLMALDKTELQIIANTGTEKERKYARAIMPVRAHGNYLLCTILLSNVAVNSTFTVILDDLTSGLVAVIGSTLAIVFIAEITPQAICARHGLLIGAKSIWIMKIVMGICAPLAWPTSKLLDYFLGEEIGTHYNRERLKELVRVTKHVNDLDKEEVNIISGALDLRKKTVNDIMTKLEDVFMLPINSILDFETMSEIVKSGYSRIPVYEGNRSNIVTVLFTKDLAFVDPDDNTALRTLCKYYQNPCNFVFEDVTLDVMLKQFKEGHKGHMAFVQRIKREGDGDPVYETIGLVTLEDVIEEMIQAEIVDETDVYTDNRTRKRLTRPLNKLHNVAEFAGHHQHQRVHISPQLTLATFQFLNTSVDPFRSDLISETVLRRLLKQDVIQHIKLKGDEDKNDPKIYVFQEGKPVDYFVLILEGRVEVTVGRENLVFEAGPFTYFGVQALTQNFGVAESPDPSALGSLQNLNMDTVLRHSFLPDYSVRAITELYYLTIKRSLYLAAKRATLMEKGALGKGDTNEQIEPEVDKLLRSVNEDRPIDVKRQDPLSAYKVNEKESSEEDRLLPKK